VAYVGSKADYLVRTINPNFGGTFPDAYRPANINAPFTPAITNDNFQPPVLGDFSTRDNSDSANYNELQCASGFAEAAFPGRPLFPGELHLCARVDGGSASIGSIPVANSTNLSPVRNANGTIPYPSLSIINPAAAEPRPGAVPPMLKGLRISFRIMWADRSLAPSTAMPISTAATSW
jgi:hypothetical protein